MKAIKNIIYLIFTSLTFYSCSNNIKSENELLFKKINTLILEQNLNPINDKLYLAYRAKDTINSKKYDLIFIERLNKIDSAINSLNITNTQVKFSQPNSIDYYKVHEITILNFKMYHSIYGHYTMSIKYDLGSKYFKGKKMHLKFIDANNKVFMSHYLILNSGLPIEFKISNAMSFSNFSNLIIL